MSDLRKGVEMVQAQMCAALDKLGVTAMGEAGEDFLTPRCITRSLMWRMRPPVTMS